MRSEGRVRADSIGGMSPQVIELLRTRRDAIQQRWCALLRIEPVNTPLANPDILAHLVPESLDRMLALLAKASRAPASLQTARLTLPACDCGNNPYRAYYIAGEQALTEEFVLWETAQPERQRRESELAAVIFFIRRLAQADIDDFCGACSQHAKAPRCRYREPAAV